MKTNLTKRRYKAQKKSACGLCKPHQRGWEDKKTVRDVRIALKHVGEIQDATHPHSASVQYDRTL
jgi:hypothetical protein